MKDVRPEPEAAKRDSNSVEMASVWIAEKGLHCSLKIGMYADNPGIDEKKAWGIILSDIARHASVGLSEFYDLDRRDVLNEIVRSFRDEIGNPSSDVSGNLRG